MADTLETPGTGEAGSSEMDAPTVEAPTVEGPGPDGQTPETASDGDSGGDGDGVDWKRSSRKWESRAKSRQAENEQQAQQLDEQAQQLAAQEARIRELEAERDHANMQSEVVKASGLPAHLITTLNGATLEDLQKQVDAWLEYQRSQRAVLPVPNPGKTPGDEGGGDVKREWVAALLNTGD